MCRPIARQYKKFAMYWYGDYGCYLYDYEVRPTGWQGGASSQSISSTPSATYCSNIGAGVTVNKTTGTAVTWTKGVSIKSYIGIDLSARTGFDTETSYTWSFASAGRLCGSNTTYPTAAQVVGK